MKKRSKYTRFAFSLNGFLFLIGGLTLFGDGKIIFGIVQIVAALVNILMVLNFIDRKTKENLNYVTLAMNVIVCISIAIDNILSGKTYIQFVWLIAAGVSLIAFIIQFKKKKNLPNNL